MGKLLDHGEAVPVLAALIAQYIHQALHEENTQTSRSPFLKRLVEQRRRTVERIERRTIVFHPDFQLLRVDSGAEHNGSVDVTTMPDNIAQYFFHAEEHIKTEIA